MKEWCHTVKERRLKWYGHMLRLPEDTPAKRALREAQRWVKKPKGGQKLTWLRVVEKDLEKINVVAVTSGGGKIRNKISHEQLAKNRHTW